MLHYKDYEGEFEFDPIAKIFFGRITNISDIVTFKSDTEDGIEQAFQESVDDYLEFCAERAYSQISKQYEESLKKLED